MRHMSNNKDMTTSQSTLETQWNSWRSMGNDHNGLHHRPPHIERIWQYPHSHWSPQQSDNPIPLQQNHYCRTNKLTTSQQRLETHGFPQGNYLGQRSAIHSTSNTGIMAETRNPPEIVHRVSSANRWRVGMSKPGNRAIPMHLWKLPARRLGLPPTHHRIHV
jgi:hypothetical protein